MSKQFKKNQQNDKLDFDAIKISIASPEKISEWSYGEVTKPETINYRTQKPERDGLFCERIFGPTKDWECYCGKYKKIRYKGVICDKCGVEVTRSAVRRERMGHIDLSVPVAHIWFIRGIPSILGTVLNISVGELEKIIYFASYVILEVNEDIKSQAIDQLEKEYQELKKANQKINDQELESTYKTVKREINELSVKKVISEASYHDISMKYGQIIRVGIGAEAIFELLSKVDLNETIDELKKISQDSAGAQKRKILKRLRLLTDMQSANIKPQSLVLTKLPVIPPDLRPMVQLDGGRFAASDLNDLYRRVLNRNNRLKKLISQGAPEVICRNEKRMLQEAVDSLIDNSSRRGKAVTTGAGQRKLRSLSDMLRGKQGRFRQNLLGKRVDYSGRSVIVVGPNLKLHQCGIPKTMALELFKPFVISKLISDGFIHNVKNATKLIEKGVPEVWDILEQVTSNAYVLLNRAPTLHRLGIQAFQPVLIEGKAIQIHPLVCSAFNADFDGDQMAVHVPLSKQACWEAENLMCSAKNLLKPASGEPIVTPRLDMVFGIYYLTTFEPNAKGENKVFTSKNEAIYAYQIDQLHVRAKIKIKMSLGKNKKEELVETSVGRILFNIILPKELRYINDPVDSKAMKKIVKKCFDKFDDKTTADLVDKIKKLGFEYSGLSGMTIALDDIKIPSQKSDIVKEGEQTLDEIDKQFRRGLISSNERSVKATELWLRVKDKIENKMIEEFDKNSPVYMMVTSGARGQKTQLTQMAGIKGLMVNPSGEIIEIPVKSNFKEGLSEFEYFISTHGARKGKSDTALRTSDAGYLTRRLVDVAQDIIIMTEDCKTTKGISINVADSKAMDLDFSKRLTGRVTLENICDPKTKNIIVKKNEIITEEAAEQIEALGVENVIVRSVMKCQCQRGVCQKCYGYDLATGKLVNIGEAVGVMGAQAIGEPGTQLTLKTFHMGGVSGEDITTGLPRVEELFEARRPRTPAIISEIDGKVKIKEDQGYKIIEVFSDKLVTEEYSIEKGYKIIINNHDLVKTKQVIAVAQGRKAIRSKINGQVSIKGNKVTISSNEKIVLEYKCSSNLDIKVKNNQEVNAGQELTEGHLDLSLATKYQGVENVQKYIIKEILEIYNAQGQSIDEKHIEVIVKQMFSKVYVLDGGDSEYLPGQVVSRFDVDKQNKTFKKDKKSPVTYSDVIIGITRVALKTESFLSAASFQETTSVLINSAIKGAVDSLQGLKENVIIGKLIPAGTGFPKNISKKFDIKNN